MKYALGSRLGDSRYRSGKGSSRALLIFRFSGCYNRFYLRLYIGFHRRISQASLLVLPAPFFRGFMCGQKLFSFDCFSLALCRSF